MDKRICYILLKCNIAVREYLDLIFTAKGVDNTLNGKHGTCREVRNDKVAAVRLCKLGGGTNLDGDAVLSLTGDSKSSVGIAAVAGHINRLNGKVVYSSGTVD